MTFTIRMISNDRLRVALEEAVEDGGRPSIENTLAHGRRQVRPTHVQLRSGTALNGVIELDGDRRTGVRLFRLDRNPPRANAGLQKPARLIQLGKPIAIALPRCELETVALGQLQPATQLPFGEAR